MKIGITSKQENLSFLWGFTNDHPCVHAEVALPREVMLAVGQSMRALGSTREVPIAHLDEGSHGIDAGLVFVDNVYEKLAVRHGNNLDFEKTLWEVSTRISCGPTKKTQSVGYYQNGFDVNQWDGSHGRIHISVRGSRATNPRIGKEEKDSSVITHDEEQVNFSMRWIDEKFDDWNNFALWKKDNDSNSLGNYELDMVRTTYFQTKMDYGNNSQKTRGLSRLLAAIGPRKTILPAQPKFEEVCKLFKGIPAEKVAQIFGYHLHPELPEVVPAVGYAPVLEVLEKYGDVSQRDARRIPKMTPKEGAQYMFEKVLPAMLNYARTR